MEYASEIVNSGMITVFYGGNSNLGLAMEAAKKWIQENASISHPVCQIANYICEGTKVIAGHYEVFLELCWQMKGMLKIYGLFSA